MSWPCMEAASTVLHQSAWAADGTSCGQRDKDRGKKKKTELLRGQVTDQADRGHEAPIQHFS